MANEELQTRLAAVEASAAGNQTEDDVLAGAAAGLAPLAEASPCVEAAAELRFTVAETWAQKVLVALLMRRGFKPYRKRGQHATTIMVVAPPTFVRETMMAEYAAITTKVESWIDRVTGRIVAEVIGVDDVAIVRGE
jgi:hypothetical protein